MGCFNLMCEMIEPASALLGKADGCAWRQAREHTSFFALAPVFALNHREMIPRYSRPEMREIWSEQRKLEIWLQIELLATEALVAEGLVPKADFEKMKSRAAFSLERAKELE